MNHLPRIWCSLIPLALALAGSLSAQDPSPVQFNRDIRPILSDNCFKCHGPDKATRKAGLRLDTAAGALGDRGGYRAFFPGKSGDSEAVRRIRATGKEHMPPAATGKKLNAAQIALLRRWIDQGAKWQQHWSLLRPGRPPLPAGKNKSWPRNPLDYFVLARLEQEGLAPSPEADRIALLRRVSLDLTGLPPTPAEVDAFVADKSPDAYEKVVDRLFAAPRYGERMALPWLAAARYADTNGYQTDGDRIMWRWRDWVIDAFNANMPFDQFTIEQIAGDMLPGATLEQKIATGFNRNHRGNSEGGVIPEEYAVEYVVDRIDTTFTVWLGLTMGCAKCHDHKYDPISQKEFYQVFAYFNNVPEKGKAIKYGNSPPYIKAPTREQAEKLKSLLGKTMLAEKEFRKLEPALEKLQRHGDNLGDHGRGKSWSFSDKTQTRFQLRGLPEQGDGGDLEIRGTLRTGTPGGGRGAVIFGGNGWLRTATTKVGDFGFFDKFSMGAWIFPTGPNSGPILSRIEDTSRAEGYHLLLQDGKVHVHLVKRWLDDAIRVETAEGLQANRWSHVFFTYDGSRVAGGLKVYLNGKPAKLKIHLDDLNQSFATKEPLRIGAGAGLRFHGAIEDVQLFSKVLSPQDAAMLGTAESIPEITAIPYDKRTLGQSHKLRTYLLQRHEPKIRAVYEKWQDSRKELEDFDDSLPTTMVMEEMNPPRQTHILIRGEYDKKGPKVSPGLPHSLPPLPAGVPNNRLGFAQWLVDPANPLTARVTVNRYWQMLFGAGLVKSVEDFGAQGDWPSHPDLLDWLAMEFQGRGPRGEGRAWDVKAILKTIVTSATYRQSSRVTKELLQKDPDNRLLARGPRVRLPAEIIRDQALLASGLLVEKLGGPSVKPYQPVGLQKELHGTDDYKQDQGAGLYRRSLYTYWKRTVAPPAMMTFDAPGRETCIVREARTNTPLQALNLMNDVTYVEAARVLAQRVLEPKDRTAAQRLEHAFRLAATRPPTQAELAILVNHLEYQLERMRAQPAAAKKLVEVGEFPRGKHNIPELAAYTAVASLILNLDEVITKE